MTAEVFLKRHGEQWLVIKHDPLYRDLVEYLRSGDPARMMPDVEAQSATEHAQHLLGRIAGFNLAIKLLTSLEPSGAEALGEPTYENETASNG